MATGDESALITLFTALDAVPRRKETRRGMERKDGRGSERPTSNDQDAFKKAMNCLSHAKEHKGVK